MDNEQHFKDLIDAYNASIVRFNTLAARGISAATVAEGCRRELKTTLRVVRQLIDATRHDPALQECYVAQLKALKRAHYNFIMVEACATELSVRHN